MMMNDDSSSIYFKHSINIKQSVITKMNNKKK